MIQTSTIEHFPVILVGEVDWRGLLDWLRTVSLAARRIEPADLAQLRIARGPDEVVEIVGAARDQQRRKSGNP